MTHFHQLQRISLLIDYSAGAVLRNFAGTGEREMYSEIHNLSAAWLLESAICPPLQRVPRAPQLPGG